jgi:hypothetical protein
MASHQEAVRLDQLTTLTSFIGYRRYLYLGWLHNISWAAAV